MSKIIAIHSFRGGTGKSNLAANLTTLIARAGKRVGVIDTDIQSPGIHILFGMDEESMDRSLNDYLWGKCAIEQTAYDVKPMQPVGPGQVAVMSGGVYLIPSSLKAGDIAKVLKQGYDVNVLNDGFRELIHRLQLDYLLIDTHPGLNEETLLSIAISDALVIMLRPDQQDYLGTAVTIEVARKLSVPWMRLVVNKVWGNYDFAVVARDVAETFQLPVIGVLPLCEEMLLLESRGIFCLRFPNHPLTRTLEGIARHLLETVN